jgi:murein DD-endopeptidase MepM/ murein hydrolase activator NlpD
MTHKFSLIFLGSTGSTIKQIHCSRKKLIGLVSLLFACVCVFGYFFFDYLILHKNISGKNAIERDLALQTEEVLHQREQIQKFASEINELKQRLVKLDEFEKQIRIIANIDHSESGDGLFGIGGSAPEDLNPNIELTKRHQRLIKDMHQQVSQLNKATDNQKEDFESLLDKLEAQKNLLAHTPTIRPVNGWITSGFGYRQSPFTGKKEFHNGMDIANRTGTEIIAPADGVVSFLGPQGLYGQLMVIDHGHGITTRYAHLDKALFKRGDRVVRGKTIALMGNTGRSTGPHLHYEIRLNGVPVNPSKYIMN